MPEIAMTVRFKPLRIDKLNEFEQSLGGRLPEDYRNFLMQYNGGQPIAGAFECATGDRAFNTHILFGINDNEQSEIRVKIATLKARLPMRLIPVGSADSENVICISIAGPDRGKVYVWERASEADPKNGETPETTENVISIAESFSAFLRALH